MSGRRARDQPIIFLGSTESDRRAGDQILISLGSTRKVSWGARYLLGVNCFIGGKGHR